MTSTTRHPLPLLLYAACVLFLTLAISGCPGRGKGAGAPQGGSNDEQAAAEQDKKLAPAKRDLIDEYLGSDNSDMRQFAMLFAQRFKLTQYSQKLLALGIDDPLAAVAADAISGDGKASLAWQRRYSGGQAQSQWFGGVSGFQCAAALPADFWLETLDQTSGNETTTFCLGMARLDFEPGGPLQMNDALKARLEESFAKSSDSDVLRRFAIDSLLGTAAGRQIDFKAYLHQPALMNLADSQWAGLLRHAPVETWRSLIDDPATAPLLRGQFIRAAGMVAPPELSYKGMPRASEAGAAKPQELALLQAKKLIPRMPLRQVGTLIQLRQQLDKLGEESAALKKQGDKADQTMVQKNEQSTVDLQKQSVGVIVELSDELMFACRRSDASAVKYALESVPALPESAASAVFSTISRYGPQLASDEDLAALAKGDDRSVAYWLVYTWGERPAVQQGHSLRLLLTSPNHENLMLGQAYERWLRIQGVDTKG